MKQPFLVAVAALATLTATSAFAQQGPEKMEGKPVPAFKMKDTTGTVFTNKSLAGKVVLFDFWATWCGPCKAASPMIDRLSKKFASKGVVVIGVNITDTPAAVAGYKKQHKYSYHFTANNSPLAESLGVTGIPAFFFIDKKGIIQDVQTGFSDRSEKEFSDRIVRLINEK